VFYRGAGTPDNSTVVLLGGFATSSHQFRNLLLALEDRFHLIAPNYPGFGNSEMPDPARFPYTFDRLSGIIEGLLSSLGIRRFGLYMHDYGSPIGDRILGRHPEWLEWLIVQNANLYEEGFTSVWDGIRYVLWTNRSSLIEARLEAFLSAESVARIYLHGYRYCGASTIRSSRQRARPRASETCPTPKSIFSTAATSC
jgi:pimeloyl-ACP methyl ester carboxylesterase